MFDDMTLKDLFQLALYFISVWGGIPYALAIAILLAIVKLLGAI